MEPIPALMARLHIITPEAGQVLTEFKPTTDAITMELTAWFAAPAAIIAIFKMFSFFTCHRGEADRRMIEVAKDVAEERAKVVLSAVPQVPNPRPQLCGGEEMEPDHSEEAVLEIEGEEPPAFVKNPETLAEVMAAAVLKADPDKPRVRRARTKKPPHKDSVLLWIKERTVDRPGRSEPSDLARGDYDLFCSDRNLTPVGPKLFGTTLRERGIEKIKSGGKTKYLNIGLRPALRVVSG